MPHHNGVQTGVRPKGQQLAACQLLLRFVGHGQRCMAVLGGIAVAGEMLEGRQNAVLPQSVCHSGGHGSSGTGIGREGAGADDRVVRVGVHIGIGRKVHIEAVFLQISADGLPHGAGILGVAACAHGGGAGVAGQRKRIVVRQTGDKTALLIHRDKKRRGACVLQILIKTRQLGR